MAMRRAKHGMPLPRGCEFVSQTGSGQRQKMSKWRCHVTHAPTGAHSCVCGLLSTMHCFCIDPLASACGCHGVIRRCGCRSARTFRPKQARCRRGHAWHAGAVQGAVAAALLAVRTRSRTCRPHCSPTQSLAAGGMAGMCAKTAVAPLDRMKILRQVRCGTYHHLSMAQTLRLMVAHEGLRGLYKGNGAQLVRVFPVRYHPVRCVSARRPTSGAQYAAVQFVSHEQFRRVLDVDRTRGAALMLSRVAAGSLAGLSAVACTYPLDLVRCRLSAQVHAARYQVRMQPAPHV